MMLVNVKASPECAFAMEMMSEGITNVYSKYDIQKERKENRRQQRFVGGNFLDSFGMNNWRLIITESKIGYFVQRKVTAKYNL